MIEPTPVHIELDPGIDHDAIERERSWDCLAGEAPMVCSHVRIKRSPVGNGLTRVTCECGASWSEVA